MKVVIIGNGVAGITAARTLRDRYPDMGIEVFTEEPYPYYPRPWLIDFLAGKSDQNAGFFYPPEWYLERHIDVHLNTKVASIDTAAHALAFADGTRLGYDRLLLAMGARPNVPPVDGVHQEGVFTLRTLDDALSIKRFARPGLKALVVGGGLLGLESARALKALGLDVVVVENRSRLLPLQLDEQGAQALQRQIEALGIGIVLDASLASVLGNGRTTGVALTDGRRFDAEMILFSTGIKSNIEIPKAAGLSINRGVVVNERLATSSRDIYAAGDIAEAGGRVYGIVPACIDQARVAAENLVDNSGSEYHGTVPSNTLQVMGIDLTSVGVVNPDKPDYEEIRWADESAGVYKKLVLQNGRAVGAILLGDKKSVGPISRLVREKTDVSRYKDRILQPDFDFRQLPR